MAIVIAGLMIAVAIVYSVGKESIPQANLGKTVNEPSEATDNIRPFSSSDHILGNANAPVKIVEFSDTECPFCKRFHSTMHRIVKDYDGKVAWVYRHFPLDSLHSKARTEAKATECANELGGNSKFWSYLDRLFEVTPSNNGLDLAELPRIAEYVGLPRDSFEKCLNSAKHDERVQTDSQDAIASGGEGTPYSIIIGPKGKRVAINGAQDYPFVKAAIDALNGK